MALKSEIYLLRFPHSPLLPITSNHSQIPHTKKNFTQKQIEKLTNLTAIRNKICHMRDISIPEYKKLVTCHKIVISKIKRLSVS